MTNTQALQILNDLIEKSMAAGNIKDFKTLDLLREAISVLQKSIELIPK